MKNKIYISLCIISLFAAVLFSNCTSTRHYDFSLKNTLSIFLLNNEKGNYFCIPIQYFGDYHIESFEFTGGYVTIGDYEISLKRENITITAYLNEAAEEFGKSDGEFKLVHSEENGSISISKMSEPLTQKHESDETMNHYYIFIERYLTNAEMEKMIDEYKKGNVHSIIYVGYDITIDNEEQAGSGMYDDFELFNGPAIDPAWFPQNLDFFKAKYLQK